MKKFKFIYIFYFVLFSTMCSLENKYIKTRNVNKHHSLKNEILIEFLKGNFNNLPSNYSFLPFALLLKNSILTEQEYQKLINEKITADNEYLKEILNYFQDKTKGNIKNWFVCGPFVKFYTEFVYPPEYELQINKIYHFSSYFPVKWYKSTNISKISLPPDSVFYLLNVIVVSNLNQNFKFKIATEGKVELFINKYKISIKEETQNFFPSIAWINLKFKTRTNIILLKISNSDKTNLNLLVNLEPDNYSFITNFSITNHLLKPEISSKNSIYDTVDKITNNFWKLVFIAKSGIFNKQKTVKLIKKYISKNNNDLENNFLFFLTSSDRFTRKEYLLYTLSYIKDSPFLNYYLAEYYYKYGFYNDCIQQIKNSGITNYKPVLFLLGKTYFKLKKYGKSKKYFLKCVKENLNKERAENYLNKIYQKFHLNFRKEKAGKIKKTNVLNLKPEPGVEFIIKNYLPHIDKYLSGKYKYSKDVIVLRDEIYYEKLCSTEIIRTYIFYASGKDSGIYTQELKYFPLFQNIKIKKAELITDSKVKYQGKIIYSRKDWIDKSRVIVKFPYKKGIIILQYRLTVRKPEFGKEIINQRILWEIPYFIKNQRIIYIVPAQNKHYIWFKNFKRKVKKSRIVKKGFIIYRWESKNIPALENEKPLPDVFSSSPAIFISSFKNYKEMANFLYKEINKKYQNVKLISNKKVVNISNNLIYGWIRPPSVIKNSPYILPFEKALLMAGKLNAKVGLIRKGYIADNILILPILSNYHRPVVITPNKQFIDPITEKEFDFNWLKNKILVLDKPFYRILPGKMNYTENILERKTELTIYTDLLVEGRRSIKGTGWFISYFKEWQRYPDEYEKNLTDIFSTLYPESYVYALNFSNSNTYSYKLKLNNYCSRSNSYILIPYIIAPPEIENYITQKHGPLIMDFPYIIKESIIITYKGFKIKEIPESLKIKSKYLDFYVKFKHKKDKLKVVYYITVKSWKIPNNRYNQFINLCKKILKKLNERIILEIL